MVMEIRELVRQFLLAWWDSIGFQAKLIPGLAKTLSTTPENIYYQKAFSSDFNYTGTIQGTEWQYFFHGLADCDLKHTEDGRFLQINFGPKSRFDTLAGWGTMLFIMASKSPWPVYPDLKQYLADAPPPYTYLSGSYDKMLRLFEPITKLGLFEPVDKTLCDKKIKLKEKYTFIDDEGRHIFSPPSPYNDFKQRVFWDLRVCDIRVLSEQGRNMFANNLEAIHFYELGEKRVH